MAYPLPLLLIDEKQLLKLVNHGTFKFSPLTFNEVDAIIETHEVDDILCCFSKPKMAELIFNALQFGTKDFEQVHELEMKPGQDAIVFKLYTQLSEPASPVTLAGNVEAKKAQDVYICCELLTKIE